MTLRFLSILLCCFGSASGDSDAFNGRWVIEPLGDSNGRVMWLEVNGAGSGDITGAMVGGGPGGQLDTIRDARIDRGQLTFHLERAFRRNPAAPVKTPVTAALHDGRLLGVTVRRAGPLLWVGRRAPVLTERDDGSWQAGEPIALFDGSGLDAWHDLRSERPSGWYMEQGVLKNRRGADLLVSDQSFWNFHLHIEYRVHPGMNGGIALRGRYEIQILDDHGQRASDHGNGALYGRLAPTVNASRPAGEWQTLEIRLVGPEVTVVLNGVKTIDRGVIEGFTAMATDWREGEPGPITLQGDHGAVEFRKILLTPLAQ